MAQAQKGDSVEVDEMWTFVQKKSNPRWIWLSVSFLTRQVLAFAVGDRSLATAKQMWAQIPEGYRRKHVYTDHYSVYPALFPSWQHHATDKGDGRTNTVERVNLTLRQRLAFLVRKTIAFAKREDRLVQRLTLFLHRYNEECEKRFANLYRRRKVIGKPYSKSDS